MSDRELAYIADFTGQMATRKYAKVRIGHPFGSQLGVNLAWNVLSRKVTNVDAFFPLMSGGSKIGTDTDPSVSLGKSVEYRA